MVVPKSTIPNWVREFKKWAPFFRVVNLNPKKEYREQIIKNEMRQGTFDVIVTTYDALKICGGTLKKYEFNYGVFDEAHKMKNDESQVAVVARKLKTLNRLLLTGTPLQNDIGELWSLLNFLMPKLF